MITKLAYFTNLKSLKITGPRIMGCDTINLVKNTLPLIGKNLEYLQF